MSSFSKWFKEQKGKTFDLFTDAKDATTNAVREKVDTITGKAVLEEMAKFAQETEAVNTAVVTHVLQLHDQHAKLDGRLRSYQADYERNNLAQSRTIRILTKWLVATGCTVLVCLAAMIFLLWKSIR